VVLAWALWLVTFGCCAAGLGVAALAAGRDHQRDRLRPDRRGRRPGPGPLEEMGIDNPFGLPGPAGSVAATLMVVGVLLHWWSLPPAAVCVVQRFRSSRGIERQQMRWVAAGVAGAVVLGLGRLLPESSSMVVAVAALAVVAAFAPLRRRVQDLVDRRFNRRRYDAAGTVEAFAARLRDQVDLDALHGELLAVVTQTMQPTRASLWLRHAP
jgi:hypothetical protein